MADVRSVLNAEIARLSYLTNGKIGQDWRSGRPFVAVEKGREWDALVSALEVLRMARHALGEA